MSSPYELDQDTIDFIEKSASFYPDQRDLKTVDQQRQCYADLCAYFHSGIPDNVTTFDEMIGHIPIRTYASSHNPKAQVLYIHGGGFVVGGLESHDDVCAEICDRTGLKVTAVDYRLAPEHRHPAALDDCRDVLKHLISQDLPVIVAGDSAGGWLTAMLGYELGAQITGQVLIYPMLGSAMNQGSYITRADAPMLTTEQIGYYWGEYFDCPVRDDIQTVPMAYPDLGQVPPTFMIAAEYDPLCTDVADYEDRLKSAGLSVNSHLAKALPHGFLRARHRVKNATIAFDAVIEHILLFAKV